MGDASARWEARLAYIRSEYLAKANGIVTRRDGEGRLHCDDGPAYLAPARVTFFRHGRRHGLDADWHGTLHHYHEGVRIPASFHAELVSPGTLTVEEVLSHPNLEVRMTGIRILGPGRVLSSRRARIIDRCDRTGMVLFKIRGFSEASPVRFLKVVNSTPEPDGSRKDYFLCVPPSMQTCAGAVAWTFGLEASGYKPTQET